MSTALSAGAGVAPSGADSTVAGAGSAGLAAAPNIAVGLAIARPAFDSPLEHAPQTEGLYLSPARAALSHATIAANPALTGEVVGGREAGALPKTESVDMETGAGAVEMPSLRYSDLLTEFLPFDRSFVENAIDRFLDRFESLGAELTDLRETTSLIPVAAATAVTTLAVEVALRRWRRAMRRTALPRKTPKRNSSVSLVFRTSGAWENHEHRLARYPARETGQRRIRGRGAGLPQLRAVPSGDGPAAADSAIAR